MAAGSAVDQYLATAFLKNGEKISLRLGVAQDRQYLEALLRQVSRKTTFYRFAEPKSRYSPSELDQLLLIDRRKGFSIVAFPARNPQELIGIAQCYFLPPAGGKDQAEVAFLVHDHFQGVGVGSLLLDHLADLARFLGLNTLKAEFLGGNRRMLRLFEKSGFMVEKLLDGGTHRVICLISPTDQYLRARQERRAYSRKQRLLQASAIPLRKIIGKLLSGHGAAVWRLVRADSLARIFAKLTHWLRSIWRRAG